MKDNHIKLGMIAWILVDVSLLMMPLNADKHCSLPKEISRLVDTSPFTTRDTQRNARALQSLCMHKITFNESGYRWNMLLVTNPNHPKGPFWFLPHDDERTAFDAAVYATGKYGGGFLSVMANDQRYFSGQDPNRNFGDNAHTEKICKKQKYPAPRYSKNIFKIIDNYRPTYMPYLALHNNKNGWYGNGGAGGISILNHSSRFVESYPANKSITKHSKGLEDEDSLVYISRVQNAPDKTKLKRLKDLGFNVKYEVVDRNNNDCSFSNYLVLHKHTDDYYNIEVEHGDYATQKKMIDGLMSIVDTHKSKSLLSIF